LNAAVMKPPRRNGHGLLGVSSGRRAGSPAVQIAAVTQVATLVAASMAIRTRIPVNDLRRSWALDCPEVRGAVARVIQSGWYVHGPEHAAFEAERFVAARLTFAAPVGFPAPMAWQIWAPVSAPVEIADLAWPIGCALKVTGRQKCQKVAGTGSLGRNNAAPPGVIWSDAVAARSRASLRTQMRAPQPALLDRDRAFE